MTYETLSREEAGGVLRKLEEWITRHIPAQRTKVNDLRKTMQDNSRKMSRKYDDLPESTKEKLKKDAAVMNTVNMAKREADRSHANY